MKERPIIFQTEMVKAILDGRKTQTRRVVKPQPTHRLGNGQFFWTHKNWKGYAFIEHYCPYGKPGDLLYVRENWFPAAIIGNKVMIGFGDGKEPDTHEITTDKIEFYWNQMDKGRIIPSIHLPKSASRIWLKVTDVRVERLQDINEHDAKAEGVETLFPLDSEHYDPESFKNYTWHGEGGDDSFHGYSNTESATASFASLWFKINGAESWGLNPWVWVISFEVVSTTGKPKTISNLLTTTP